jgi:predicted CoA-substrate-specific enzyme activase
MLNAGIDIGTLWTKAVVLEDNKILGWSLSLTGESCTAAAEDTLQKALEPSGASINDIVSVIATGAGQTEVCGDTARPPLAHGQATDVVCVARGIKFLNPDSSGVIDMGGESTLAVKLDEKGRVADYTRNDKCAAGTGIFLDAMGKVMGVEMEEMGPFSLKSAAEVNISSMCVVFAESEVVSLVHRQTPKEDIISGIHKSIATRIFGLVNRIGLNGDNMAIGGLARNVGILYWIEEMMKKKLIVPENPQIVSALGAAVVASESARKRRKK